MQECVCVCVCVCGSAFEVLSLNYGKTSTFKNLQVFTTFKVYHNMASYRVNSEKQKNAILAKQTWHTLSKTSSTYYLKVQPFPIQQYQKHNQKKCHCCNCPDGCKFIVISKSMVLFQN